MHTLLAQIEDALQGESSAEFIIGLSDVLATYLDERRDMVNTTFPGVTEVPDLLRQLGTVLDPLVGDDL